MSRSRQIFFTCRTVFGINSVRTSCPTTVKILSGHCPMTNSYLKFCNLMASLRIMKIVIFNHCGYCLTTCKHIVRSSLSFTSLVNLSRAASTKNGSHWNKTTSKSNRQQHCTQDSLPKFLIWLLQWMEQLDWFSEQSHTRRVAWLILRVEIHLCWGEKFHYFREGKWRSPECSNLIGWLNKGKCARLREIWQSKCKLMRREERYSIGFKNGCKCTKQVD